MCTFARVQQVVWAPLRAAEYINASNLSTLLQRSRTSNLSTVVFFSPAGETAGEEQSGDMSMPPVVAHEEPQVRARYMPLTRH